MQIVIDIPRKIYERIRAEGGHGCFNMWYDNNNIVTKAVYNGTPLPKGHGRLGDIDGIADYFREVRRKLKASDYKTASEFHTRDNMLLNTEQFIRTCGIIEADKEVADDK